MQEDLQGFVRSLGEDLQGFGETLGEDLERICEGFGRRIWEMICETLGEDSQGFARLWKTLREDSHEDL